MFSDQIDEITMNLDKPNQYPHPIVYRALIRPEKANTPVPSRASLLEEAIALVIAGTDTTGSTLTVGTYQILKNPEIYARLKAELMEAWPNLNDRPTAADLEKLPYLVNKSPLLQLGICELIIYRRLLSKSLFAWHPRRHRRIRDWFLRRAQQLEESISRVM